MARTALNLSRHPGLDPGPAFSFGRPMERQPCVYLLARASHSTFYTGVTSNLEQRIAQHRSGAHGGFAAHWNIKRLVWFELHDEMAEAIRREKTIKRWSRQWKYDLIAKENPTWRDLAEDLGFEPLLLGKGGQAPAQGRGDE